MIRVVIVDDHGLVRAGLEELLSAAEEIEVVATAADGEEAVEVVTRVQPDIVLMDLSMPTLDGVEATRLVMAAEPGVRVVVLTSSSERDSVLRALDAGAVGYLLKDSAPDELQRGIHAAARGESPLDPKAAQAVLAARTEAHTGPELSPREREVLELVAEGMPNKLIARRLEISEKTVKTHLTRVFHAIDVTDRTQAALWARRHGVGDPPKGP
jgi:DNA-binding NarL/FixJ family response regulator